MKTQLWVYVVVAVLSLGAGVAIAGVPTFEEREATIQTPTEPVAVTSTTEAPLFESADTDADADAGAGNEASAGAAATDDASDDDAGEATDDAAEASTTTTTTTSTTTTTTMPLADRTSLNIVAANGANVGGAASAASAALEAAGYGDVISADGTDIVDVTVIFAAEGLQGEAERLAADTGVDPALVFPLSGAPGVASLDEDIQIVVYLGRDVVGLDFFS
ncbi:MAG: LytR C-terminal domain-containing protein [Ilumatobacter sp.]